MLTPFCCAVLLYSQWNRADNDLLSHHLHSLPFAESRPVEDAQCEVCLPKKNHAHNATHKLILLGSTYEPNKLKHPFKVADIILATSGYDEHESVQQQAIA